MSIFVPIGRPGALVSGATAPPLDFGFTIFVTVIPAALQPSARRRPYRALLSADGEEVAITRFDLRAPENAIGSNLTARLATPDPAFLSPSSTFALALGVHDGTSFAFENLLSGAKLSTRDLSLGMTERRPSDAATFTVIDSLADRWQLAPAAPTSLIGDASTSDPTPTETQDMIHDEAGAALLPLSFPVANLTLREALRRAYVVGCGFDAVVTNIPDYRVPRVDFSIHSGYHESVSSLLALYEPVYAPVGNTLWIIDPDEALNSGAPAYDLPLGAVVTVKDAQPARTRADAVVVSYQEAEDFAEVVVGERFEEETTRAGSFGEVGYTETFTRKRLRQYAHADAPLVITREVAIDTTTTVHNHLGELVHRETQQDSLDGLGRKTGHTRTVESLLPTIEDGAFDLQVTEQETCSMTYRPHPLDPRRYVQDTATTYVEGLILQDNDNEYLGRPFKLPLIDAHRNGFIDLGADQERLTVPIRTKIEQLRTHGAGALDVSVVVIDHLANTTERSSAQPRVGEISFDATRQRTRRVIVRLPGATTSTRRVPEFSAGEVPRAVALALAKRKLARLNTPPRRVSITLPAVDFAIRRGATVRAFNRTGASGVFIVTGYAIMGEKLGSRDQTITMSLDAVQLTAGL
jgi:hypothetical protein